MSYILRTWHCLNGECASEFESGAASPTCPVCKCVKVSWVPGGGHMMSPATLHNDRTVRSLAKSFGLSNLKSARQGEAAHPGVSQGKPMDERRFGPYGGIPWSDRPTAAFCPNPPNIKIAGPSDGSQKFKKHGGRIPTDIRPGLVDNRKVPV